MSFNVKNCESNYVIETLYEGNHYSCVCQMPHGNCHVTSFLNPIFMILGRFGRPFKDFQPKMLATPYSSTFVGHDITESY